ncbi:MAG: hypothetical protein AAF497_18685 [Planctomycetota bacterium]
MAKRRSATTGGAVGDYKDMEKELCDRRLSKIGEVGDLALLPRGGVLSEALVKCLDLLGGKWLVENGEFINAAMPITWVGLVWATAIEF